MTVKNPESKFYSWKELARLYYNGRWGRKYTKDVVVEKFKAELNEHDVRLMMVQTLASLDETLCELMAKMHTISFDVDLIERRVNKVLRTREERRADAQRIRRAQHVYDYLHALEARHGPMPRKVWNALKRQLHKTYQDGSEMLHVAPCGAKTKTRTLYDEWITGARSN